MFRLLITITIAFISTQVIASDINSTIKCEFENGNYIRELKKNIKPYRIGDSGAFIEDVLVGIKSPSNNMDYPLGMYEGETISEDDYAYLKEICWDNSIEYIEIEDPALKNGKK